MRRISTLLTLAATGCSPVGSAIPTPAPYPLRVMSMNQCTDQLVLALLPPERITSVTWLSRDPGGSLMAREAMRVGVNHGLAEEVLAQKPDLVVAGSFTTPALRGMLKRIGYPLLEVDNADDFDGVRRLTRQVAAAVGERARGEALIADMDAKLASLARERISPIRVVAWDRSGFAAGKGTLYDTILSAAGARNLVRAPMTLSYRKPDTEVLLQANPALLVQGTTDPRGPSLGDDVVRHPLVRHYWRNRILPIAQGYYICGTPMVADAALKLHQELHVAAGSAGPALPTGEMIR